MSTNVIDSNGIQIQSLQDIIAEILNGTTDYPGMYSIYGADINVAPNSPDGQMINIIAQAKLDMLEFILGVYNSFDPDLAVGVQLDERCAINGVFRNAGTFTITNVSVVTTAAVTLQGLDTNPVAPFTVADGAGNQFQLLATTAIGGAGTTVCAFQAVVLGAVLTTLNTITNIVTPLLGVASVNNPSAATTVGLAEESDYNLRIRRANSVALPSKGFLQGLFGGLIDVTGVTSVLVLENITNTTDGNGIPGHSIWCVVKGGSNADIANVIYLKRNAGCGMKGSVSVPITQVDLTVFNVLFDRPVAETLYVQLSIYAITGSLPSDSYVRAQLVAGLTYNIGQSADASTITALLKQIAPNCAFSVVNVSFDNATWVSLLAPAGVNYQFSLVSGNIAITHV